MRELKEIVRHLETHEGPAALATVVDVQGSSYRLPGAKMLVMPDGTFVGTVSGGCVEADVLERAARVIESGSPEVFLYDTTVDESSVFSLNMGCRGVVRVLLEKVTRDHPYPAFLKTCVEKGDSGYVAAGLGSPGSGEGGIRRAYFDSEGNRLSGDCAEFAADHVRAKAVAGPGGQRPSEVISDEDGKDYFVEYVSAPRKLLILGAGADAIPLSDLASNLGWSVTVYDHRPLYASRERFPMAERVIVERPENLSEKVDLTKDTAAVVMSHNLENDKEYLGALLASEVFYVGALGPRIRTEEMLEGFRESGNEVPESRLRALYAPVGLDTGASEPETIAVAIIAEIQAAGSGRPGRSLRDRRGPIYDR